MLEPHTFVREPFEIRRFNTDIRVHPKRIPLQLVSNDEHDVWEVRLAQKLAPESSPQPGRTEVLFAKSDIALLTTLVLEGVDRERL